VDRGGFGRYVQGRFQEAEGSPAPLKKVRRIEATGTENG
jgi:hypothetical protein